MYEVKKIIAEGLVGSVPGNMFGLMDAVLHQATTVSGEDGGVPVGPIMLSATAPDLCPHCSGAVKRIWIHRI